MKIIEKANLEKAYGGSYYFIAGCGGDLKEWVEGYEKLLADAKIGKPKAWYKTTGKDVNDMAVSTTDPFQDDCICLLFPIDGLDMGKLPIFKLQLGDRWFDDVVNNMRWKRLEQLQEEEYYEDGN